MTLRELKTKYDEFKTITDENEALEAVQQNGYAVQYVNTLIFRGLEPDNKEIIEQLKNIINKLEGGL